MALKLHGHRQVVPRRRGAVQARMPHQHHLRVVVIAIVRLRQQRHQLHILS